MRASKSSKSILAIVVLSTVLNACASGHPSLRANLNRINDPERVQGQVSEWWEEHRRGKVNPIHEELDRVLFCSYGPCVEYARAHAPVVEEAIRAQITKSLTREVAAAAVNDRVKEYRATAVEYAALRTVSALNYGSTDEVAVEARRLLLDLRLFREADEDLASEALLAPTAIAAMVVKHRYPELHGQLRREIQSIPGGSRVIPLLDETSREDVPVVFLSGFVPLPREQEEIVAFPTGRGKTVKVKIVYPELPPATSRANTCSVRTAAGATRLLAVADNYALSESAMERRSNEAKERSALRSTAKSLVASKAAQEASKEAMSVGVDLAANASSAEGAAVALAAAGWAAGAIGGLFEKATQWTEKADLRSASLVPLNIFIGRISSEESKAAVRVDCEGGRRVEFASERGTPSAVVGLFQLPEGKGRKAFSGRMGPGN